MISVNRKGEVWVFAEQHDGKLEDIGLELLGRARMLGDTLGVKVAAVLIGDEVKGLAEKLCHYGADKVYLLEHPLLEHYQANSYSKVIYDLIHKYQPQIMIYGASPCGRDLAPRVASATRAGLTADCTDLQIGDHQTKDVVHKNLLLQIRPAFGGNIIATIINYDRWPQMAEKVHLAHDELPLEILNEHRREKKVNLKASRIVVSGGAGVGSKENFRLIWDLANALGAAPGATRAAVDLGFIDRDHQVGQTGTTVRPSLYIAVGISGAIQHQAGMSESAKIIAVNNDPQAPIFDIAHYKVVGDLNEIVPKMIKAIKARV